MSLLQLLQWLELQLDATTSDFLDFPDQLYSFGMKAGPCGPPTLHSREKSSHLLLKRPSLQQAASVLFPSRQRPRKPTQMARLPMSLKEA